MAGQAERPICRVWLGGPLCLDFVNTIEAPISREPEDFLDRYAGLVRWGWHARAFGEPELKWLKGGAAAAPERAALRRHTPTLPDELRRRLPLSA